MIKHSTLKDNPEMFQKASDQKNVLPKVLGAKKDRWSSSYISAIFSTKATCKIPINMTPNSFRHKYIYVCDHLGLERHINKNHLLDMDLGVEDISHHSGSKGHVRYKANIYHTNHIALSADPEHIFHVSCQ